MLVRMTLPKAADADADATAVVVDCYVPLERVFGVHQDVSGGALLPPVTRSDCESACVAAVLARKPPGVHSALMSATKRLKVARAFAKAGAEVINVDDSSAPTILARPRTTRATWARSLRY
eukprot:6179065-Pleurochrysis_carterae.AAC.1